MEFSLCKSTPQFNFILEFCVNMWKYHSRNYDLSSQNSVYLIIGWSDEFIFNFMHFCTMSMYVLILSFILLCTHSTEMPESQIL